MAERLLLETVGGDSESGRTGTIAEKSDATDARLRVRVPIKAGPREVTATFVRKIGEGTNRLRPFDRSNADTYDSTGRPHVETLTVLGPFLPSGPGDSPSRRRIFNCVPENPRQEEACARRILSELTQRAYRRPVTAADLELLLPFYKEGRQKGTFETGIQLRAAASVGKSNVRIPRGGGAAKSRWTNQRYRTRLAVVVFPLEQHSGQHPDGIGVPRPPPRTRGP